MQLATTTQDKLKTAIEARDYKRISALVDYLRFHCGMNYRRTYDLVAEMTGLDPATWDEILYECDERYSQPV